MGPGLLGAFRRGLFAVGIADLGKLRRRAAFRVDSACETAQKSQTGLAGGKGGAVDAAKRAGCAGRVSTGAREARSQDPGAIHGSWAVARTSIPIRRDADFQRSGDGSAAPSPADGPREGR